MRPPAKLLVATLCCLALASISAQTIEHTSDPLPSWHETPTKARITSFVAAASTKGSSAYVPPAERIAVFDNDGCLWAEQPVYFQLCFAMDQIRAMAPGHPEWATTEPFRSVLAGDQEAVMASGKEGLAKLLAVTHTGMTAEQFQHDVASWLAEAEHPTLGRRYLDCVYKPQLELLDYLRAHGFKTYIVSGGGIDFLRVFAEEAYGIPPEQVIGSSVGATYEVREAEPVIVKQTEGYFINDKAGKPVGIHQHIGRRPILAVGNSDGDFQMLEYTTHSRHASDTTKRLGILIHHDDDAREFAYDRTSHVGRLDRGLDEASERGWLIVSMRSDWSAVFPSK